MTDPCQIKEDTLLVPPATQQSHAEELIYLHHVAAGRELHMMNLEREVNELCRQQGVIARYPIRSIHETAMPKAKHQSGKGWAAAFKRSLTPTVRQHDALASRQATEQLLARVRESEERYRALFESINEGF